MKMFYKIQIYYYHDKLHLKHVQNNTQKHSPGQQRFAAINGAGKKKKKNPYSHTKSAYNEKQTLPVGQHINEKTDLQSQLI